MKTLSKTKLFLGIMALGLLTLNLPRTNAAPQNSSRYIPFKLKGEDLGSKATFMEEFRQSRIIPALENNRPDVALLNWLEFLREIQPSTELDAGFFQEQFSFEGGRKSKGIFLSVAEEVKKEILKFDIKVREDMAFDAVNEFRSGKKKKMLSELDASGLRKWAEDYFYTKESTFAFACAGELYFQQGNLEKGIHCYESLLRYHPDMDPKEKGPYIARVAAACSMAGDQNRLVDLIMMVSDYVWDHGDIEVSLSNASGGEKVDLLEHLYHLRATTAPRGERINGFSRWTAPRGNEKRNGLHAPEAKLGSRVWCEQISQRLVDKNATLVSTSRDPWGGGRGNVNISRMKTGSVSHVYPVFTDDYIALYNSDYLYVIDPDSGCSTRNRLELDFFDPAKELWCFATADDEDNVYITSHNLITLWGGETIGNRMVGYNMRDLITVENNQFPRKTLDLGNRNAIRYEQAMKNSPGMPNGEEQQLADICMDTSPVIKDGIMYFTGFSAEMDQGRATSEQRLFVMAYDMKSQRLKWKASLGNSQSSMSSILLGNNCYELGRRRYDACVLGPEYLYCMHSWGSISAINPETGAIQWIRQIREYPAAPKPVISGQNFFYHKGKLIGCPGNANYICCWNAETGEELWTQNGGIFTEYLEYVLGISGDLLVYTSHGTPNSKVYGVDLNSGRHVWCWECPEAIVGQGALTHSGIYLPTARGLHRLDIIPGVFKVDEKGNLVVDDIYNDPVFAQHYDVVEHPDGFYPWVTTLGKDEPTGPSEIAKMAGDVYVVGGCVYTVTHPNPQGDVFINAFVNDENPVTETKRFLAQSSNNPWAYYLQSHFHHVRALSNLNKGDLEKTRENYQESITALKRALDRAISSSSEYGEALEMKIRERLIDSYKGLFEATPNEKEVQRAEQDDSNCVALSVPDAGGESFALNAGRVDFLDQALEFAKDEDMKFGILKEKADHYEKEKDWPDMLLTLQHIMLDAPNALTTPPSLGDLLIDPDATLLGRNDVKLSGSQYAESRIRLWMLTDDYYDIGEKVFAKTEELLDKYRKEALKEKNFQRLLDLARAFRFSESRESLYLSAAETASTTGKKAQAYHILYEFIHTFPKSPQLYDVYADLVTLSGDLGFERGSIHSFVGVLDFISRKVPSTVPGGHIRGDQHFSMEEIVDQVIGAMPKVKNGHLFEQPAPPIRLGGMLSQRPKLIQNNSIQPKDLRHVVFLNGSSLQSYDIGGAPLQNWSYFKDYDYMGMNFVDNQDLEITSISPRSPFYSAGLRKGDTIISLGGKALQGALGELSSKFNSLHDEDTLKVGTTAGEFFIVVKNSYLNTDPIVPESIEEGKVPAFHEGKLYLFEIAAPKTAEEGNPDIVWTTEPPLPLAESRIFMENGRIFLIGQIADRPHESAIYAYDSFKGELLWERRIPGSVLSDSVELSEGFLAMIFDKSGQQLTIVDSYTGQLLLIKNFVTPFAGTPGYLLSENSLLLVDQDAKKQFKSGIYDIRSWDRNYFIDHRDVAQPDAVEIINIKGYDRRNYLIISNTDCNANRSKRFWNMEVRVFDGGDTVWSTSSGYPVVWAPAESKWKLDKEHRVFSDGERIYSAYVTKVNDPTNPQEEVLTTKLLCYSLAEGKLLWSWNPLAPNIGAGHFVKSAGKTYLGVQISFEADAKRRTWLALYSGNPNGTLGVESGMIKMTLKDVISDRDQQLQDNTLNLIKFKHPTFLFQGKNLIYASEQGILVLPQFSN